MTPEPLPFATPADLPTPYGIIDITSVPWAPGFFDWSLILLAFTAIMLVAGIIIIFSRRGRIMRPEDRYKTTLDSLQICTESAEVSLKSLEHCVGQIKKFLTFSEGLDFTALTSRELISKSKNSRNDDLAQLLLIAAEVEQLRYRSVGESVRDFSDVQCKLLSSFINYYQSSKQENP